MINEIQTSIITALEAIPQVKTVGIWQGDLNSLLERPTLMPALQVAYQGGSYSERKTIGRVIFPIEMTYTVFLFLRNLQRDDPDTIAAGYTIIEDVRQLLIGLDTGHGKLWPVSETLVAAEHGTIVYGLDYRTNFTEVEKEI